MKVVVINGAPRSGKDTFIKLCNSRKVNVIGISIVDEIKRIAKDIGWDGEKNLRSRKFLSDLKDLADNYNDFSFNRLEKRLSIAGELEKLNRLPTVVFVVARDPKDISRLVEKYRATALCIRRTEAEAENVSNHADKEILNYSYDIYINNDGSLEKLEKCANAFMKYILGGYRV